MDKSLDPAPPFAICVSENMLMYKCVNACAPLRVSKNEEEERCGGGYARLNSATSVHYK